MLNIVWYSDLFFEIAVPHPNINQFLHVWDREKEGSDSRTHKIGSFELPHFGILEQRPQFPGEE